MGEKYLTQHKKKAAKEKLPDDPDGNQTIQFLRNVRERLRWITGEHDPSLGLHPAIYTYSRAGAFQPTLFLAMSEFVEWLKASGKLKKFQSVRKEFEDFLFNHKALVSEIGHRLGSGSRSIKRIVSYYGTLIDQFTTKKTDDDILKALSEDDEFLFLLPLIKKPNDAATGAGKRFTRETKTAAFLTAAVEGGVRCTICGALVHKNSMNFDHKVRVREQGSNAVENAGVSHFWCNSDKQ